MPNSKLTTVKPTVAAKSTTAAKPTTTTAVPVIVTGARSIIGQPVVHELIAKDYAVTQISRSLQGNVDCGASVQRNHIKLLSWDMITGKGGDVLARRVKESAGFYLIHCAPIWFLPQKIEWLIQLGLRRVIVFSSSSIDGKVDSSSDSEQQLVNQLKTAEDEVITACKTANIEFTIFRPTMIYGYGQGQNLAFIATLVKRFKCFPVASPAMGLRQPVHADDLAKAVIQAVENTATYGKTYTLSGAEALPYQEMVKRVFIALGYPPRVLTINRFMYRLALSVLNGLAKSFGKSLPIDPAMIDRMQYDLSFDHSSASTDFGYTPGAFLPNGVSDLVKSMNEKNIL